MNRSLCRSIVLLGFLIVALGVAGCTDMYDNQKLKPLEQSKFYADGLSSRPLVEGTVARGQARADELLYTGKLNNQLANVFPFPVTDSVLARGQDRYNIFCAPCHGRLGNGKGMIVQRGFPQPNAFTADSVRIKPAGHYFDVMTNGFGRMYSYAASVPVHDRWAIVSYIRALQLSQRVAVTDLTQEDRTKISELPK